MESTDLTEWIPEQALHPVSSAEGYYTEGFLASQPEKWFPGFSAFWLPIIHALDIEAQFISSLPVLSPETEDSNVYIGTLNQEYLGLIIPKESFALLSRILLPSSILVAQHISVEYFARRFLHSLASSWSASDGAEFRFQSNVANYSKLFTGGINLSFRLNGQSFSVTVGLNEGLVDRVHDLWCSHLANQTGVIQRNEMLALDEGARVELVMGIADVKPSEVNSVLQPGNVLPLSSSASIYYEREPYVFGTALLGEKGGVFRSSGDTENQSFKPGATPIRAVVGSGAVEKGALVKLRNKNSYLSLPFPISSDTDLYIGDQVVASGTFVLHNNELGVQISTKK